MAINMQRNKQTWNITDVINYSTITDAKDFGAALQQIDTKLNDIKKEITYWDVYNISSAITSAEQFESKIANLEINNSTVINTTYFKRNFQGKETEFYSGDIIIRLKDGSYQHIKAANAGVYIPTITDNDSGGETSTNTTNLKITYNYATTVAEDQKKIWSTIKTLDGASSKTYGYSLIYNDNNKSIQFTFPKISSNEEIVNGVQIPSFPIVPVLKFFDKNNQEVYTDEYTLSSNGSNYSFYLHNNNSGLIQKVVIK